MLTAAEHIYRTALSTDPSAIAALLGLARVCLARAVAADTTEADASGSLGADSTPEHVGPSRKNRSYLARAYEYTTTATRLQSTNFEAWWVTFPKLIRTRERMLLYRFLLGRVLEEMGLKDQAVESFVTSMEHEKFSPVRPFECVLMLAVALL
jgi:hypothetical protein